MLCIICTASVYAACDTPEHSEFDFWLGQWRVLNTQGEIVGANQIAKAHDGCVIKELYSTPKGYSGESLNIFDKATGSWHQTWVDNSGLLLHLAGHFKNGAMVLSGASKSAKGQPVMHKISWTPDEQGEVRQLWRMSQDNGSTWTTVFDGRYVKIKN